MATTPSGVSTRAASVGRPPVEGRIPRVDQKARSVVDVEHHHLEAAIGGAA
jgi:hypothetical protein